MYSTYGSIQIIIFKMQNDPLFVVSEIVGIDSLLESLVGITAKCPILTALGLVLDAGGIWLNLRLFSSLCEASKDKWGGFDSNCWEFVSSRTISGTKTVISTKWIQS